MNVKLFELLSLYTTMHMGNAIQVSLSRLTKVIHNIFLKRYISTLITCLRNYGIKNDCGNVKSLRIKRS